MERSERLRQSILCCEFLLSEIRKDCEIPRKRFEGRTAEELARIRHEQVTKVERIQQFLLSKI